MRLAVARGDHNQRAAGDVPRVLGFEPLADVGGDPHDVLHHRRRVLEDVPVDLLVDVADPHAALVVGGGVGFVDVPDLERLGVEDFPVDLELLGDVLELLFLIGHMYLEVDPAVAVCTRADNPYLHRGVHPDNYAQRCCRWVVCRYRHGHAAGLAVNRDCGCDFGGRSHASARSLPGERGRPGHESVALRCQDQPVPVFVPRARGCLSPSVREPQDRAGWLPAGLRQ